MKNDRGKPGQCAQYVADRTSINMMYVMPLVRRCALLLFVCACVSIGVLSAQERRLGVDEAAELALRNNLDLARERLNMEIKQRDRDTAWNVFVPQISAGGTWTLLNEPISGPTFTSTGAGPSDGTASTLGFNINAQLTLTAQVIGGLAFRRRDYESGQISLRQARENLERDVRRAYYNLQLIDESIAIAEEAVGLAQERYERAQINFDNGLVDEFTLLSAQVAFETSRPNVDDLQIQLDGLLRQFNLLIGLDIDTELVLTSPIAIEPFRLDVERLVSELLPASTQLQALHTASVLAQVQIDTTIQSFLPTLTFGYQWQPSFLGDPLNDPLFADIDNDWQLSGGLSVTLSQRIDPFLPASQTWTNLENQRVQLRQTELRLQSASQSSEIQLRTLTDTLEKIRLTLDARDLNTQVAQRAFDLAQESYNAGVRDLIDVREAERNLQSARFDALRERFNYISTLLDLRNLLGIETEELQKYVIAN